VLYAFIAALAFAQMDPSASPSPAPPVATKHTLQLNIPPGWVRTESGRYNEWRTPDGSNFRVAPMPFAPQYQGDGASDAIKESFETTARKLNPKAQITVLTVKVCNGQQTAYRINDPLGMGSAGFMVIIPGPTSTGLINYEAHGSVDPPVQQTIDKICWP
jgi:hypothetical protein